MKKVSFFFILIITSSAHAIECPWWQTNVKTHTVQQHERNGSQVTAHPRKEHCREKWKGADKYIKQFANDSIAGWPLKEKFKGWKKEEIQTLLEIMAALPAWTEMEKYNFYRAIISVHKGNSATSEVSKGSIVFYDQFFKEAGKDSVLVHEAGHHLFKKLTARETEEFATLSGWKEEVSTDRKIYILPPKLLIKPDSAISKEEDFTNHLEVFFTNSNEYKVRFPKIFEFFHKRFPL